MKDAPWVKAMNEDIDVIEKNQTWDLVDIPGDKTYIGFKWVYKTKLNENGELEKNKARLVVKGYAHKYGVDCDETFAYVARMDTMRAVLAIATQKQWHGYQMDAKYAFLNGILEEGVYVDQQPCYTVKGHEKKVYKMKKALYGLKRALRALHSRIDSYIINNCFSKSNNEPTLYVKTEQGKILMLCLYVDDMIYT